MGSGPFFFVCVGSAWDFSGFGFWILELRAAAELHGERARDLNFKASPAPGVRV